MAPAALRVGLLGGLTLDGIGARELGSRKGRQLLAALALGRGRVVSIDQLLIALWGDDPPSRPSEQLGVLVSRLRAALGGHRIVRRDAGYALVMDWLDVDELEARVEEAAQAHVQGRFGAAVASARAALVLDRGALLPEERGLWVEPERSRCAAQIGRAYRVLGEAAMAVGDVEGAAAAGESGLAHDPYDEASLRILMRSHAAAGRPAAGLAAYVRTRERLAEDLGVAPAAETESLHDELVLGRVTPITHRPTALVGRDRELAVLDAELARSRDGDAARAVVVRGEAGIGKTALVSQWRSAIGDRAVVLTGRCDELGRDLPLQPVCDALSRHLRGLGEPGLASALGDDAAALDWVISNRPSSPLPPYVSARDRDLERARLYGALVRVLERLGEPERPVVLVIEDLHDADPSTISWMAFAVRRAQRLLIVATTRPNGPRVPGSNELALGPLDREASVEIVGDDRDDNRVDDLIARSGGNPLLLSALATTTGGEVPSSIREVVENMCARLGAASTTIVAAAVIGEDVDLDLVAGVVKRPAVDVLADLEAGLAAGLLVERTSGLSFKHPLFREALVARAGSARRALVHREAAEVLHRREPQELLAVAQHARLGGQVALAAEAFVAASAVALARHDTETARDHLDAAIELAASPAAYSARARLRMVCLDVDGADADAQAARALSADATVLETSAWVSYYQRHYEQARAFAESGARRAANPDVRASCLAVAGRIRHASGELDEAAAQLEPALEAAAEVGGVAAVWLAHVRVHQGRPADALSVVDRALIDPDRLAHPWAGLHGRFARAMALGHLGRVAEALRCCDDLDRAIALSGETGVRFVGIASNVRGWLLRAVGRLEEAAQCHERAIASAGDVSGISVEARAEPYWVALLDLAEVRLAANDPDGAERFVERAGPLAGWSGTMGWHQRHRLALIRARLALLAGDAPGARALADSVRSDAQARGAHRYRLLAEGISLCAGVGGDAAATASEVVSGLGRCAALDGWPIVAVIARRFDVPAWSAEADKRSQAVVASAGPYSADARRHIASVLSGIRV